MKKGFFICFILIIITLIGLSGTLFFFISYPLKYKDDIIAYSSQYNLQPYFVASVINVESNFNKDAISDAGAVGLMQLMPSTASFLAKKINIENYLAENLDDPKLNIQIGCYYLRYLINTFGDEKTALYAYNAGEGNVRLWLTSNKYSTNGLKLEITPYKETNNFYDRIKNNLKYYKSRI